MTDKKIVEQAARWLVLRNDQPLNPQLDAQFQDWIAANPKHQAAFERLQNMIDQLDQLAEHCPEQHTAKQIIKQSLSVQHPLLAQLKKSMFVLALFGICLGMLGVLSAPLTYWFADQRSSRQSWRQMTLPDQSQIELSGKSAINIHYTPELRKIELLQGNIRLDVATDRQRPLLVETKHGVIQALGTQFIVSQTGHKTIVSMLSSRTAVWAQHLPKHKLEVIHGHRLELDQFGLLTQQPIAINATLLDRAWQQRRLMVNGESLVDVLDYLAMFSEARIMFDRQALAQKRVTANLALDDVDQSLQQLADELGLEISRFAGFYIHLKAR